MAQLNAYQPLYLKHRPQSLTDLVGQQAVTRTLTNAIEHNRLTHAYLFTGPRGTGKTSSARILAKSLNCHATEGPTATPCQRCSSCLEIKSGNSPAVFEIDAASNNSVDDARTLIERAPLVAVGSRFKVYIIDECHMLTKEAFNALLKTIEDPPKGVVFILATTEEHKVLPTIVSRCQRLMFRLARLEDLTAHLQSVAQKEGIEIEASALQFIARRSGGGLRDALGLLDQASLLSSPGKPVTMPELLGLLGALHEDVLLKISAAVQARNGQELLSAVAALLDEGREPAVIAQELSRHFLNLIKASYMSGGADATAVTSDVVLGSAPYIQGVTEQAPHFDRAELAIILQKLDELEQTCRRTSQPAMHLEIGMISICHRRDFSIIGELDSRLSQLESGNSSGSTAGQAASPARPAAPVSRPNLPPPVTPAPAQAAAPAASAPAPAAPAASASVTNPEPASPDPIPAPATPAATPAATPTSPTPPTAEDDTEEILADETIEAPELDDSDDREPEGTTYIESVAVIPDQAVTPPAVPNSTTPSAQQSTARDNTATTSDTTSGDEDDTGEDIEHIWSELLAELQQRNIPTFSMASTHGFPLAISRTIMEVGTTKEVFQKSLEQRVQHLQAAAQIVCRRPIAIRVRLVSAEMAAPPQSKPRQRASAGPQPSSQTSNDDADEIGEPATPNPIPTSISTPAPPASADKTPPETIPESGTEPRNSPPPAPNTTAVEQQHFGSASNAVEHDATTIKEAYKLFEGPGSRLVQKPKN